MKDLYSILGVARDAGADDIKRAYRRLAMKHHPDRGGDQAQMQEVQQAYDTLSDPQRRRAYDNPQPQGMNFNFGDSGFQDIFSSIFGQHGFDHFHTQNQRRGHVRIELWISLYDVAHGGSRTVSLSTQNGATAVEIDIPRGVNDGNHVQYPNLAPNGQDLVVTYRIRPDPVWQRQGLHLITVKDLVIWDLILGTELKITDILGKELVTRIPPGTQPNTKLRLRGLGLQDHQGQQGDLFIEITTHLPPNIDPAILDAIRNHHIK